MGVAVGGIPLVGSSSQHLNDLAQGIIKVLSFIHNQGQYSFNLSLPSAVAGDDSLWTLCHIMPRTTTPPMDMSDCSYLDTLLDHASTAIFPEQIAQELREYFR